MHFYCRQCIGESDESTQGISPDPFHIAEGHIDNTQARGNESTCKCLHLPLQLALTRMYVGPSCRTPISKDKLFIREAFEPTDEELIAQPKEDPAAVIKKSADDDDEMPDIKKFFGSPTSEVNAKASAAKKEGKGKGKAKFDRKPRPGRSQKKRRVVNSEDEGGADDIDMAEDESAVDYEDSDLSDFIVHTDEDEDEKDARKASRRLIKRRATTPIESEESDDDKIILGRKRPTKDLPGSVAEKGPIKLLSRMLPSTKMLVRNFAICVL